MAERSNNKDNKRLEARLIPSTEHSNTQEESDLEPIPDVQVSTCVQMPLDFLNDILDMEEEQKFKQFAKDSKNQEVPAKGDTFGVFGNTKQALGPDAVSDAVADAVCGEKFRNEKVQNEVFTPKGFQRDLSTISKSTCCEKEERCEKESLFNGFCLQHYLKNHFQSKGKTFSPATVIQLSDLHAATLPLGIKLIMNNGILIPVKKEEQGLNKQAETVSYIKDIVFASPSNCFSIKANAGMNKNSKSTYFTSSTSQVTSIPPANSENTFLGKSNMEKEQRPTVGHAPIIHSFSFGIRSSQEGNRSDPEKPNIAQLNTGSLQTAQSTDQLPARSNFAPDFTTMPEPATNLTTSPYSANKLKGKHTSADNLKRGEKKRTCPYERSRKTPAMSDLPSDYPT